MAKREEASISFGSMAEPGTVFHRRPMQLRASRRYHVDRRCPRRAWHWDTGPGGTVPDATAPVFERRARAPSVRVRSRAGFRESRDESGGRRTPISISAGTPPYAATGCDGVASGRALGHDTHAEADRRPGPCTLVVVRHAGDGAGRDSRDGRRSLATFWRRRPRWLERLEPFPWSTSRGHHQGGGRRDGVERQ